MVGRSVARRAPVAIRACRCATPARNARPARAARRARARARRAAPYNDGRGFYGATNDKVVTDAGFIMIVFFPLFVFVDEHAPAHLDKRKEARKAAHKALMANGHWRGGW